MRRRGSALFGTVSCFLCQRLFSGLLRSEITYLLKKSMTFRQLFLTTTDTTYSTDFSHIIAFRIAKNYKHKIASFTKIPLYLFSYKTSIFTPKTEITSHSMTENIRHARFPQLVFQTSLFQLENRHLIFTDASKEESGVYVKIGFFLPTLQAHKIYRTDSNSSVFSGECIAIIHAVEYIFANSV